VNANDSIAIVGAGAVGLYYGGRLARAGHAVHFLSRSDADAIRDNGIRAQSIHGDFTLAGSEVHVHDDVATMPKVDWVISTLKATARPSYRGLIGPLLKDETPIVALQNGLGNEEELAAHFGPDRVLGAIAYVCIHRVAPGMVTHTAQGELKVGEYGRPISERLAWLVERMRSAKIEAVAVDDLRWHRWDKLVWNVPFNGLGAALDLDCAQLMASDAGLAAVRAIIDDVLRAAAAVGVTFDPKRVAFMVDRTRGLGAYQTSMQLDRRAGRAMEIDAIVGEVIRQGEAAGCGPLTTLRTLEAMLRAVDGAPRSV
jgi:2-dehydropantoate 2-reductase